MADDPAGVFKALPDPTRRQILQDLRAGELAAGDIAMLFMAKGGVYLFGGISQKILPALRKQEFRAAFEDKAPHSHWLRAIPTYVVTHPLAALAGLSFYARAPETFGVSTDGRRWRA